MRGMTGPELKDLREKAGVTQAQLALRAGWSHRAVVSQIEGRVLVAPGTAQRYLKALTEEQASRVSA